jgi:hypothetical protein
VLESGFWGFVKEQFFSQQETSFASQTCKTTHSTLTFHEVRIIRPHHPLYGKIFPVVRTSGYKRKRYYILELPDKSHLQIPMEWACEKDIPLPQPILAQPVCTVESLRVVLSLLRTLKNKANATKV